jgi:hypothetical protein
MSIEDSSFIPQKFVWKVVIDADCTGGNEMIYGHNGTIHHTQKLNIEIDKRGGVVSVWFRCCALPFDVTVVDESRAIEMANMSDDVNKRIKLNAVDVEVQSTRS